MQCNDYHRLNPAGLIIETTPEENLESEIVTLLVLRTRLILWSFPVP